MPALLGEIGGFAQRLLRPRATRYRNARMKDSEVNKVRTAPFDSTIAWTSTIDAYYVAGDIVSNIIWMFFSTVLFVVRFATNRRAFSPPAIELHRWGRLRRLVVDPLRGRSAVPPSPAGPPHTGECANRCAATFRSNRADDASNRA